MKKFKLLIGISGKMGTGKSTVSNILREATGAEIISMASPIYKLQDMIYDECNLEMKGDKDRDLLIALGLWGRSKDKEFWLEQFANKILQSSSDIIICDDVRFPQEAEFFRRNGFLFRITGAQRGNNVDESKFNNESETALDDYEFENVLDNSESPKEMCMRIAEVLSNAS